MDKKAAPNSSSFYEDLFTVGNASPKEAPPSSKEAAKKEASSETWLLPASLPRGDGALAPSDGANAAEPAVSSGEPAEGPRPSFFEEATPGTWQSDGAGTADAWAAPPQHDLAPSGNRTAYDEQGFGEWLDAPQRPVPPEAVPAAYQPPAHQPPAHQPPAHQPPAHQPPAHQAAGYQAAGYQAATYQPGPYLPVHVPRNAQLPATRSRPPLYPQNPEVRPGKSFHEGLAILQRGRWLILAVFLAVMGGVLLYTFLTPPRYEAYALLLVDTQQGSQATDALSTLRFMGGTDLGGSRKLSNQAMILEQSLPLAQRTSERLMEIENVPQSGTPLTILDSEQGPLTTIEVAERLQKKYVTIKSAEKELAADALTVFARSRNPGEAALIANLYADEYVKLTREASRQSLIAQRLFLEEQIDKNKGELLRLEEQVKQYKTRTGAVALDQEASNMIGQIALLDAELDATRIDLQTRQASASRLDEKLAELQPKLVQRVSSGVERELEEVQSRIAQFEMQREEIYLFDPALRQDPAGRQDLMELNTKIAQLEARASTLSSQYVEELVAVGGADPRSREGGGSFVGQLQQKLAEEQVALKGLQAKENALRERLGVYSSKLQRIPSQALQLVQLERERATTERNYLQLVQKLQETRIAEESELGFAEVIRPALVPVKPVKPNKPLNLIFGGLLGLLLGLTAAVARHKLDTRVHGPDDLRDRGYSLLGVIPDMRRMIKKEFDGQAQIDVEGRAVNTSLVTLLNPFSPTAEAYRRLYTNLQFSSPDTGLRTILVTSPEAGAGKSVTALNLAITAAQAGKRVLLIDADLRLPSVHEYLGLKAGPGLREVLFAEGPNFDPAAFATGVDNLFAFTVSEPMAAPSGLLGSQKMQQLIYSLRSAFDLVIFDSPPMLVAADAMLLAALCDATLVVAGSRTTDLDALSQTFEELHNAEARVTGVVLNRFDPSINYEYKHTYGYRYQEGAYYYATS